MLVFWEGNMSSFTFQWGGNITRYTQKKQYDKVATKVCGKFCRKKSWGGLHPCSILYSFQKHQASEPCTFILMNLIIDSLSLFTRKKGLVLSSPLFRNTCLVFFLTRLENCFVCNPLLPCKESPWVYFKKIYHFQKTDIKAKKCAPLEEETPFEKPFICSIWNFRNQFPKGGFFLSF